MSVNKIMVVFGTRPEAIKMCPVVAELKRHKNFKVVVSVTGQHRKMLDQVLECFNVVPNYDLSVMQENQELYSLTANILLQIQKVLEAEQPDVVLVHGDTTTAFATALACYYSQIAVGHVEAGLRTYNIHAPYPEEFNRQAIDSLSSLLFAPTNTSKDNLLKEGKNPDSVFVTGNTVIDALKTTARTNYSHPQLDWASDSKLVLLTAHRRENLGRPLEDIFKAILRVVNENPDIKVLYPVHLNPKVLDTANRILGKCERIRLIEPLDILDFHNFIANSYIVLTDSGGIQEEAPSFGKPVLVLRDTTERPEGVAAGTLRLVGTNEEDVYREFNNLLVDDEQYSKMSKASNPYGDGHASQRIAKILDEYLA